MTWILPRTLSALRVSIVLATALVLIGTPARAIDIPSDLKIDLSSIAVSKDELICLALNDYWEARSETMAGRIAVAKVVLNRAMDRRFPSNICAVVKETKVPAASKACQFSWYCDAKADMPYEMDAWRTSLKIATAVLQTDSSIPDPTGGALWYHADFVKPSWAARYETTTIIGGHVFYREHDSEQVAKGPVRKPFIYRMNAFAEFVGRMGNRRPTAIASADLNLGSSIGVQSGPAPTQPLAR